MPALPRSLLLLPVTALAVLVAGCLPAREKKASQPLPHPFRLGDAAVPTAQDLELEIDPEREGFTGRTSIRLEIRALSDSLRLHAEGLAIREASLDQGGRSIPLTPSAGPAALLVLRARETLAAGPAVLRIGFAQAFNTQSVSLYKVKSAAGSHVFTQFEAWEARKAFPCFDEPAFKIPWKVRLRIPSGHMAVGNYPAESETTEGRWKTVDFAVTRPMPSYLVALAVGDFDTLPVAGMSVPGRVIAVKGQGHLARQAAAMAPPLLKALEAYFGQACPYPKLDFLSVPEFMFGAMENPGAITFRENLLLFDSVDATLDRRRKLAAVMAHEMAHLWFGDLVTMSWWDDLWLNESFASWMGDRTVEEVFPDFKLQVHGIGGRQWAMSMDAMRTARVIRTEVLPTDNPTQSFDGLAYEKGQAVLGMLEGWMGREPFRKGVNAYLREFAWGNSRAGDLWRHLSLAAGREVGPVMADFLDRPGVPLVEMAASADGAKIGLKQRRFLLSGGGPESATGHWRIPMVLRCRAGEKDHRLPFLLAEPGTALSPDFAEQGMLCHPNDGEEGYYRWNLPAPAMDSLAARAGEILSERERTAFLGNQSALSEAGLVSVPALLDRLGPFAADSSPYVLSAILGILEEVDERYIERDSEPAFARLVQSLLRPVLDRVGWSARSGEDAGIPGLRSWLLHFLAEAGRDGKAGRLADSLAAVFLEDRDKVDPSLARMSLMVSAARGDAALFRRYRREFEKSRSPVLRSHFLSALGAFRDPAAVDLGLAYTLAGPLRPHEFLSVPKSLIKRREHRDRALAWMMANHEAILKTLSPQFAVYLPWNASYSEEAWARSKGFFLGLKTQVPGMEKELEKVEEAVRHLEAIRKRDGEAVKGYLARFPA